MSEQITCAIYAASVRKLNRVIAERDALVSALAAKQAQVDGLLAERAVLRAEIDDCRETISFEVSAVTDDGAEEELP